MHQLVVILAVLIVLHLRVSTAQLDEQNENEDLTVIELCKNGPGHNSTDPYCACHTDVINCDFSSLRTYNEHEVNIVKGSESIYESVKRICFCGGPNNMHLYLNGAIPYTFPKLHRVDFYNIPGLIHLRSTFSNYFSGDVYMSHVKVNTIHSMEFNRGNTFTLEDTSGIKCCSKIEPKRKLTPPVLHIENTQIGLIKSLGINSFHTWSTIVMNNVSVKRIERNGIQVDNRAINVSLTDCRFESSNATSISVNNAANFFMARTVFTDKCHPLSFGSVSALPGSNIILMENYFNNSMVIKLDAKNVLMWLNHFDRWDSDTFLFFNKTVNKDRTVSLAYNVVEDIKELMPNDIQSKPILPGRAVVLHDNVLGYCDCTSQKQLSPSLTSTRCQTDASKASGNVCHLQFPEAKKDCKSSGVCVGSGEDYVDELKEFFRRNGGSLDSSGFISDTLKSNHVQYKLTGITKRSPGPEMYLNAAVSVMDLTIGLCFLNLFIFLFA